MNPSILAVETKILQIYLKVSPDEMLIQRRGWYEKCLSQSSIFIVVSIYIFQH